MVPGSLSSGLNDTTGRLRAEGQGLSDGIPIQEMASHGLNTVETRILMFISVRVARGLSTQYRVRSTRYHGLHDTTGEAEGQGLRAKRRNPEGLLVLVASDVYVTTLHWAA